MDWVHANWGDISTILFGILALCFKIPAIQHNTLVEGIINFAMGYVKADAKANVDSQVDQPDLKK